MSAESVHVPCGTKFHICEIDINLYSWSVTLELGDKIKKIERKLARTPKNLVEFDSTNLALLLSSWASFEVVSQDKFYHRAADVDIEGQKLYYSEKNSFRLHSDKGVPDLSCIMYIVGGIVVKETALGKCVYSHASGRRMLLVDSKEQFSHEYFGSSFWMIPIPNGFWSNELAAVEDMLNNQFNLSEILALLSFPEAWGFILRSSDGGRLYNLDSRYTGAYSLVLKSLIQGDYSLKKIAYNVGLPVSTMSKFRVGNQSLMEFVREFRRNSILEQLARSDIADIASKEGFSSKYKLIDFLNNRRVDAGSEW